MKKHQITDDVLRQYLLGRLAQNQQEVVEERLLNDPGFLEQLQAHEDELADDYADGTLQGTEREAFEAIFLAHPSRRQKATFARTMRQYVQSNSLVTERSRPARPVFGGILRSQRVGFQSALAAACVILFAVAGVLAWRVTSLQQQLDAATALNSSSVKEKQALSQNVSELQIERDRLEQELAKRNGADQPSNTSTQALAFVSAALMPGAVRDASGMQRIPLPSGKEAVRLQLVLENAAYRTYDATLQTPEGTQVWSQKGLHPTKTAAGTAVVVLLSQEVLQPEDYILRLSGVRAGGASEPASTYYFRIPR